jgi:hypothetical protein
VKAAAVKPGWRRERRMGKRKGGGGRPGGLGQKATRPVERKGN